VLIRASVNRFDRVAARAKSNRWDSTRSGRSGRHSGSYRTLPMVVLHRRIRITAAMAEPVRRFPHFGPIVFDGDGDGEKR